MIKSLRIALLVFVLGTFGGPLLAEDPPPAAPQDSAQSAKPQDGMAGMPDMPGMSAPAASGGASSSDHPWCADQTWSTFNHRTSGWFLLLWGLTALIAGLQWPRRTWVRFAPAMILFGLAEFLFFRNDPEAWPVGPMSFAASLHDPEDFQHRIFLLLVILMAVIELLRAADRLPAFLAKFGLPLLGTFGAIFLFFHKHGGPEMAAMSPSSSAASDPTMQHAMASMSLVKHEHLWFSIFGFGFAATKLLADAGYLKGRKTALWTVFAIMLGAYMIGYVE